MTDEERLRYENCLSAKVDALVGGFISGHMADGGSLSTALTALESDTTQRRIIKVAADYADLVAHQMAWGDK